MATFGTYDDRNGPVAVARRYDTLLTAVRLALDSDVGPIEWTQPDPARYYTPATGERLIVTPLQWGRLAVRPDDLDERLIRVLSGVLDRHGFRVAHAERGGFGGLELNADGPDGARFCFMGAPQLRAWVQIPAPDNADRYSASTIGSAGNGWAVCSVHQVSHSRQSDAYPRNVDGARH